MNYRKISGFLSEYLQIGLGILLSSIGLKAFLLPNGFLDGGVTGIAILISEQTNLDVSLLLVLISAPFLVLAFFTVSRRILIKSILAILSLALFIHFENFATITDDKLLIAIFGGLFLGAGMGLSIKNGAVLDGSEILGIYVNDKWGISIGRVILFFNVILFGITAMVLSMEVAMYSILTYLVTAKVVDFVIEGFEDFIGLMIVSNRAQQLETQIIQQVGAGMTIYRGETGYGSNGKKQDLRIIHTVINRIDIRKLHRLIDEVDRDAFIIEFDINNIKGGVLRKYLTRKQGKKLAPQLVEEEKR